MKSFAVPLIAAGLTMLLPAFALAAPPQGGSDAHRASHQTAPKITPARTSHHKHRMPPVQDKVIVTAHRPPNWNHRPTLFEFNRQRHKFHLFGRHHYRRTYHPPQGYYYRRWIVGDVMFRGFWTTQYRIFDYWLFDLPVPPIGCEWVQYDRDLLLIDTRTGEVVEVIYGFFA